jgi:acyl-CoA thioester hydrolase
MTTNESLFKRRIPIQLRFNDADGFGHINNNSYLAYYDLGKEDYLMNIIDHEFYRRDVVPVVANINADFYHPIFHGDNIEMQTRIARIGSKSLTFHQQAVNVKTGIVVCECKTVVVCFSLKAQSPVQVPDYIRKTVEDFEGDNLDK